MKKILLVVEDLFFSTVLRAVLEKEGCLVDCAANGKEAYACLETKTYDLVVARPLLTYHNGYELLNKINQDTELTNTRVMMISPVSNTESISQCLRLGAEVYLKWPIVMNDFLVSVRSLLSDKQIAA